MNSSPWKDTWQAAKPTGDVQRKERHRSRRQEGIHDLCAGQDGIKQLKEVYDLCNYMPAQAKAVQLQGSAAA